MCHRISPLTIEELEAAVKSLRANGRARVPKRDDKLSVPDAYPGRQVPLFIVDEGGNLKPRELVWGFETSQGGKSKLVFNTRIETALYQARKGTGFWSRSIELGRCLVPVHAFYERKTVGVEGQSGKGSRGAQVRFTMPGHSVFLIAGVWQEEQFSIVTTEPNGFVSPVHGRMPLVLGPGESPYWLGPDYARLADRSSVALRAEPVR